MEFDEPLLPVYIIQSMIYPLGCRLHPLYRILVAITMDINEYYVEGHPSVDWISNMQNPYENAIWMIVESPVPVPTGHVSLQKIMFSVPHVIDAETGAAFNSGLRYEPKLTAYQRHLMTEMEKANKVAAKATREFNAALNIPYNPDDFCLPIGRDGKLRK